MTIDVSRTETEEVTVRLPAGWIDCLDEMRAQRGGVSRGRIVAEAIQQASDGSR